MPPQDMKPRTPPPGKGRRYEFFWRIADHALARAIREHPGYFVGSRIHDARSSILKRFVAQVVNELRQRGGELPPDDGES